MNTQSKLSLVGFLAALAALELAAPPAQAKEVQTANNPVEARLTRLSKTLQSRVETLPTSSPLSDTANLVAQWLNGSDRGFANIPGGGGFVNRDGGGGFVNSRPGGGFANSRPGGGFVNRRPGGGFINNPWRNTWSDGGGFLNRR
jgi:rSAM-associated Gly-rich repeat protein